MSFFCGYFTNLQVPGADINAQAAAGAGEPRRPGDAPQDGQAAADPQEAGNHGDEAELEDDDGEDNEEGEDEEEDREEDAAEANNGGQGRCEQTLKVGLLNLFARHEMYSFYLVNK